RSRTGHQRTWRTNACQEHLLLSQAPGWNGGAFTRIVSLSLGDMFMGLRVGQFAMVGDAACVVVALFRDHQDIPDEHVGVWYGEVDPIGIPKVRTVPDKYVRPIETKPVFYH